jgi:NAD+ kinase
MKVAIYGIKFNDDAFPYIEQLFKLLIKNNSQIYINHDLHEFIGDRISLSPEISIYHTPCKIDKELDFLISIGGDGTILDTITTVRESNVPIIGINTGRLGFLANNPKMEVESAIYNLKNGNFKIDKRTLLKLDSSQNQFGIDNFALNEFTVHKKASSTMMTIHVSVNGEFLNSYWADGLIIATPTGSTAYSLSCGGPVLSPGSDNFVITPIAPHNLNLRPLVVRDDVKINVKIDGREKEFLTTLDSRSATIDKEIEMEITKADFNINLIQFHDQNFFSTIRNKLMWGLDARN